MTDQNIASDPCREAASTTRSVGARDDLIGLLYDVAIAPERYGELIAAWERAVRSFDPSCVARAWGGVPTALAAHAERAGRILASGRFRDGNRMRNQIERSPLPAFLVGPDLRIVAANAPAETSLDVREEPVGETPLLRRSPTALATTLRDLLEAGSGSADGPVATLVRSDWTRKRSLVFRVVVEPKRGMASVVAARLGYSRQIGEALSETFGLSRSEVAIVRGLVEGLDAQAIADRRGRSLATVRTQIKAVLSKTGAGTQLELMRLCAGLAGVVAAPPSMSGSRRAARTIPALAVGADQSSVALRGASCHIVERPKPDGGTRRAGHLVLGDPDGRPCLYWPHDLGLIRWTHEAESELRRRGWRLLVPLRPGYGPSEIAEGMTEASDAYADAVIGDALAVLALHRATEPTPIISQADDSFFAFALAARHPERVERIVAAAGSLPFSRTAQFERMHRWHRFILTNARHVPHVLPFLVRGAFAMARAAGPARFARLIYGSSAADVAALRDPAVSEAMAAGSEFAFSSGLDACKAFSRTMAMKAADWSVEVRTVLNVRVPVHFLNGDDDPQVAARTLREWQQSWGPIHFERIPGAGQLLLLREWRRVLDALHEPCA